MAGAERTRPPLDHPARLRELRDRLAARNIDAAVLFERGNVRHFTGWRQNSVAHSAVVVTPETLAYVVPPLDETAVRAECWVDGEDVRTFPEEGDAVTAVVDCLDGPDRIGIEGDSITARRRDRLASVGRVVDVSDTLSELRVRKRGAERALYREAATVTDEVYRAVLSAAAVGDRERDLTARARLEMGVAGAERASFEPFAMAGEHGAMPHRTATDRRIGRGELVVLDLGLVYEGYATDITRTFLFGEPSDEQRRIFEAARAAQQAAIDAVEPGVTADVVHESAVAELSKRGLDEQFPHLTGHGLGHDIHEPPIVDAGEGRTLQPGMVITVEPGVYVPGVGAARIEDMVLVTEDGHEVLTNVERDLVGGPGPGEAVDTPGGERS